MLVHLAFREFDSGRARPIDTAQKLLTRARCGWGLRPRGRGWFRHVDMVLGNGTWVGVSARSGEVTVQSRCERSARGYSQFAVLVVTREAHALLEEFASEHQGEPFSLALAAWNWCTAPCRCLRAQSPRSWYCTKLIVEAMAHAGIPLQGLDPLTATPEEVYRWCLSRRSGAMVFERWVLPPSVLVA